MTKKKVLTCLLHTGNLIAGLELQLYKWMQEKVGDYQFNFLLRTGVPASSNRNHIAKDFLKGDYDYLCMVDNDNPPLRNPFDLLNYDKDVIGAVYPGLGKNGIRFHVYKADKDYPKVIEFTQYQPEEREGLKKVDAIGTGCIFIKRKVLEKMEKPFEYLFDDDGVLVLSDDIHFCHKCNEAGFEIYAHWDFLASHFKQVDLLQMTALVAKAARTGIASINLPEKELSQYIRSGKLVRDASINKEKDS